MFQFCASIKLKIVNGFFLHNFAFSPRLLHMCLYSNKMIMIFCENNCDNITAYMLSLSIPVFQRFSLHFSTTKCTPKLVVGFLCHIISNICVIYFRTEY